MDGKPGAPLGNQNAAKGRVWRAAIERALAARSRVDQKEALDRIAEALIVKAQEGDLTAIKELGDRLDGKAHQSMDVQADVEVKGFTWQK
jgi:hypothetical protein